jgi:hypothetical protein
VLGIALPRPITRINTEYWRVVYHAKGIQRICLEG